MAICSIWWLFYANDCALWLKVNSLCLQRYVCSVSCFSCFSPRQTWMASRQPKRSACLAANNSGDATAVSQLYTEDCKIVPPVIHVLPSCTHPKFLCTP